MKKKTNKELDYFFETIKEAHRRFPGEEARNAITFLSLALGPAGELISEDFRWAEIIIEEITKAKK